METTRRAAILAGLAGLLGSRVGRGHELTDEPDPIEEFWIEDKTADGSPVIGHGITWGPRDARQSLTFWNEGGGRARMESSRYGPPTSPLDMKGPLISRTEVDLADTIATWLRHELEEALD